MSKQVSFIEAVHAFLRGYDESGWHYWDRGTLLSIPGLGTIEVVDRDVPQDEDGRPAYIVFKVTRPNYDPLYYKKSGYYYSYGGVEWNSGFAEVTPNTRTVIVYE